MEDWVVDCVVECKGKEHKRTIGVRPITLTEAEALAAARDSLYTGRRSLPEDDPSAKPASISRCSRFRRDIQDLSVSEFLAKG